MLPSLRSHSTQIGYTQQNVHVLCPCHCTLSHITQKTPHDIAFQTGGALNCHTICCHTASTALLVEKGSSWRFHVQVTCAGITS